MAGRSDVQPVYCLKWSTRKPFLNEPRQSASFPLAGSNWNLHFEYFFKKTNYNSDHYYRISLKQGTTNDRLEHPFFVIFVIENELSGDHFIDSRHVVRKNQELIERDKKSFKGTFPGCEEYNNWKITCLFYGISPPRQTYATVPTSTQTDFDWPSRPTADMESLTHDLSSLLEQKCYTDVQLTCSGRTFPAHRNILTARSEVFAAMFRNKMAESETGAVDVTDMDAEELDVFLKYVYSGKLPELSCDTASNLYAAGDKYRIQALKEACSKLLVERLTTENCLPLLVLADAHSDEDMKNTVVDFVAQNLELVKKEAWSGLNEDHPQLAISVYQKCLVTKLSKQT